MGAMRGRVDGMIVMSPDVGGAELEACLPPDVPVVLLNCDVAGTAFSAINVDNYGGALEMVRHLIGLGHRHIAIITGAAANFDARERLRGFRAAIEEAAPSVEGVEAAGDFTERVPDDVAVAGFDDNTALELDGFAGPTVVEQVRRAIQLGAANHGLTDWELFIVDQAGRLGTVNFVRTVGDRVISVANPF